MKTAKTTMTSKDLRKRTAALMQALNATTPPQNRHEWQIQTDLGPLGITLNDDTSPCPSKHPMYFMRFEDTEGIKKKFFSQPVFCLPDQRLYGLSYNAHSGKWNLALNRMSVGLYRVALFLRWTQQLMAVTQGKTEAIIRQHAGQVFPGVQL